MTTAPSTVRTFRRRGRISGRHRDALHHLLPSYAAAPDDPLAGSGRDVPVVLEIGSGMGEATLDMAAADPGRDYLAVEIHTPGIGNLLAGIEERDLTNLRVYVGDALDLLRHRIRPGSLDAVHVFFPDPWPKRRHHKRRLIQPANVALVASRLRPGGSLWCATDWPEYAEVMLATLTGDPLLVNAAGSGFASRPAQRPPTKFERRGADAGRPVRDLIFHRAADGPVTP